MNLGTEIQIEAKDLPPEVLAASDNVIAAAQAQKVEWSAPEVSSPTLASPSMHDGVPVTRAVSDPLPPVAVPDESTGQWEQALESEAMELLSKGHADVWEVLTRRFESRMIKAALLTTKGRRIEAAQKLGIGRNTITRKIQELGLE